MVALVAGLSLAVACGPKGDRVLGEKCSEDGDCEDALHCGDNGSTAGQCTRECEPVPDPCPDIFGDSAFCNGAGHCAVECDTDDVCPPGTRCINSTCDRP